MQTPSDAEPQVATVGTHRPLRRELSLFGAVMMGLGSIIGTGVFVSIGLAAGLAGGAVVWAIAVAALVALCNALSSAQLAANHAVSGGTYEYGYRYLRPWLGFTAGWMFLCAKTASAATAALGFAGYFLSAVDSSRLELRNLAAALITLALTLVVLGGLRRSNLVNVAIVLVTLLALAAFVLAGLATADSSSTARLLSLPGFGESSFADFLQACALMFVAYTGYGRIATLGEEVHEPRRTIPRAIVVTLVVSAALYIGVAFVAVSSVGSEALYQATLVSAAPLELAADALSVPGLRLLLSVGAMTAMLGVLLNLILGLSRVLLAMGRRADMPRAAARLNAAGTTPTVAVVVVGVAIAVLALLGSVKTTWSFSAFTVLVYYAITNLAALRLPREQRLYSPIFAWAGLAACLVLAFWVERPVWLIGLTMIAAGILWHVIAQRIVRSRGGAGRLRSC